MAGVWLRWRNSPTLALNGSFSGISSIFFDATGAGCQATAAKEAAVSGIITGTSSGSPASFSGITFSGTAGTVCEYASGAVLLGVNPSGLSVTVPVPASTGSAATSLPARRRSAPALTPKARRIS